jgi:hypothetical protein
LTMRIPEMCIANDSQRSTSRGEFKSQQWSANAYD